MLKLENECVGCTSLGLSCMGSSCPNRDVPRYYCDECGEETTLYYYEGFEWCADCIIEDLKVVEGSQ